MTSPISAAISILKDVSQRQITFSDALERWPLPVDDCDDALANAWHELSHFEADLDVFEKDPGYREWALARCEKLAKELKTR